MGLTSDQLLWLRIYIQELFCKSSSYFVEMEGGGIILKCNVLEGAILRRKIYKEEEKDEVTEDLN